VALQLRKHGIRHVRPLLGGFYEWKKLGYPLVDTVVRESAASEVLPSVARHSA
jgi:3-mercaptopyruvate sulfurtransferase SseA